MILIREFYIEDDYQVFTGRDCVMPPTNEDWEDWVDLVEGYADKHIPGWQNIAFFKIEDTNIVVQR